MMISLPRTTLAILLLVFTGSGCSDSSSDDPTGPGEGDGPLTARIAGEAFVSEFETVTRSSGQLWINAGATPARAIGFTVPDLGPGSYSVAIGSPVSVGVTIGADSWLAGSDQGSGSVTITTLTAARVAGTFRFTVVAQNGQLPASMEITEGAFDITY